MNDKINRKIDEIDIVELVQFCKDIYAWRTGNGDIDKESRFYKKFKEMEETFNNDIRFFESLVISKAHKELSEIVKVLFTDMPIKYIKK